MQTLKLFSFMQPLLPRLPLCLPQRQEENPFHPFLSQWLSNQLVRTQSHGPDHLCPLDVGF
jgi:hypothetical protein